MLDELGDRRPDYFCFTKLLTVWHKFPLKASLGTRRKHNIKFRQISHTTSQYGQSFSPKILSSAEALLLAVF